MGRLEDESIGTVEIEGQLALPVARQFMASAWQRSHHSQRGSCSQIVEPSPQPPGPLFSMPLAPYVGIAALFAKLAVAEQDIQTLSQLTPGVNQ
jgi:hypothetical protein